MVQTLRVTELGATITLPVIQKLRVTELGVTATLSPAIKAQVFPGPYYAFDSLRVQATPLYPTVIPDSYNWRVVSPSYVTLSTTTNDNARLVNSLPSFSAGGNLVLAVSGTKDGFTSPETLFTIPVVMWSEFFLNSAGHWHGMNTRQKL